MMAAGHPVFNTQGSNDNDSDTDSKTKNSNPGFMITHHSKDDDKAKTKREKNSDE